MLTFEQIKKVQVSVAQGFSPFKMNRGSFLYKDKISNLKKLNATIILESENELRLEFKTSDGKIAGNLLAERTEDSILLTPNFLDEKTNRLFLTFPVLEKHFYGAGETFSHFDLAGERVRIWVAEHQNARRISKKVILQKLFGAKQKKVNHLDKYESYYVQPTFVTDGKWFFHADTSSYAEFDFRIQGQFSVQLRDNAKITITKAQSFLELSKKLSQKLGIQNELPDWVYNGAILGIQQGTQIVEKKIQEAKKRGVLVAGVWCQDWCGCRKTKFGYQVMWNWQFDSTLYPELKEKISEWKKEGIAFLGYINPFLTLEGSLYKTAQKKGYCVKNAAGEDYQVTITTFPAAMVDFTNPDAWEWYKNVIKENMIDLGMSGWMADFGEYLPVDAVLFSKENARSLHNKWSSLWAKLNAEAIKERGKSGEIVFFTRAGFTETIKYSPLMWNGDQHVDWSLDDGLASVIPATLSLGMSGFALCHSDIGGYTTIMQMTRTKELLLRWEEMNVFSPFMRSHEGNQPARNVQFDSDEELLTHLARCTKLHLSLTPYIKTLVKEAAQNGTPVMRPLFYHYEEENAYSEKYEYLFGHDILVCPVTKSGVSKMSVYLPSDSWIHVWTKQEFSGGKIEVDCPIGKMPVFVRKNSDYQELKNIFEEEVWQR